jgi:starch-binding outer membrane protein, SusD/RagB family
MKNLYSYTILLISLLFLSSCQKDFLDIKPRGQLTSENYFETPEHAIWATNAVYQHLRSFDVHVFYFLGMTDMASDDAYKGSEPGDAVQLNDLVFYTHDPNHPAFISIWRGYYRGIYRANLAIQNIPNIDMDPVLRNRLVHECKLLRAYFYFNLVRWFGDIPLILEPLNPDEYRQARTPEAEVYEQIIRDLRDALEVLPRKGSYAPSDVGRATKGAAQGFLAKVYLTRGDWVNAERYARELVESGDNSLLPRYNEIFLPMGEHSSESVFEVGAMAVLTAAGVTYPGASAYSQVQGVRGIPNLGWGFNQPSDELVASYESGDPRRTATIMVPGDVLPDGSAVIQDNPNMVNERYNRKAWVPQHVGFQENGPGNIRLLRYSDVLLILAEALNELGRSSEALTYVNMVRARARGTNNFILRDLETTDPNQLRPLIWRERRSELAMEQHRWFDLKRTGQLEPVMENLKTLTLPNGNLKFPQLQFQVPKHLLFPIPQQEIDLSGGLLTQNPGY